MPQIRFIIALYKHQATEHKNTPSNWMNSNLFVQMIFIKKDKNITIKV